MGMGRWLEAKNWRLVSINPSSSPDGTTPDSNKNSANNQPPVNIVDAKQIQGGNTIINYNISNITNNSPDSSTPGFK